MFAILMVLGTAFVNAQVKDSRDSAIVFQPSSITLAAQPSYKPMLNAWGFDILVSNNGFGAGVFFRHEYTEELAGFLSFAISDVKADGEVERFDYWTGQSMIYNKANRLLYLPLVLGVQYRLFKDDIVDNFRPYLTAGIGPSLVFVAPYSIYHQETENYGWDEQIEFFSSLKSGQARYTLGGYIGCGAYFGLDRGTISGLNIRYYFSPYPAGIEVLRGSYLKSIGGLFISLHFGSFY